MFFKQPSRVLFRNYESFGLITDNRNFGYLIGKNNQKFIGDKILSESGAVFMSVISRKPQSIEELAEKVQRRFSDIDINIIKNDAIDFYRELEQDGFIISGNTSQECFEKDSKFSYKTWEPDTLKKNFSSITFQEKSTQEFLEEYFKGKPQLTNLHLEITSKCNERCLHCYIPHDYKVTDMHPELFYSILKQCKDMRLLQLTLTGGEPMLHKNFCDFLKKCKEYDFSINVLSNLTLLNEEILNEMKEFPLIGVQVSLYSMNSQIHDRITHVKGSFDKTLSAILKLVENNVPVQISCPILKQNKRDYKDVSKWAENHNINFGDDYNIIARYNHTNKNLSCRLSIKEIEELLTERILEDSEYLKQVEATAEKKQTNSDDFVCTVCNSSICIDENGNVYPCAGWQDYIVGNVKKAALKEIWDSSEKVQYLRSLCNKDFNECHQCPDKNFCNICMVRNANESLTGNPLEVAKYFCNIAKLQRKMVQKNKVPI